MKHESSGRFMGLYNAVVWLDHDQAHVFRFDAKEGEEIALRSRHEHKRLLHPNRRVKQQKEDATDYFEAIEAALKSVDEFVVAGPSTTKFEFEKYLGKHAKPLFARLLGVEELAHANDEDILAMGRRYFKMPHMMPHSTYVAGV